MELKIVEWVAQNLHHPVLDRIMVWITHLGDNGYLWVAVCLLLLCYKPTRKWGGVMALSLLLMLIFGEGTLKNLFQRARPYTRLPNLQLLIPPEPSYSFPSGHAAVSFAGAMVVWMMDPKRWGRVALAAALLILFSRLYLSVHYPTDLLAGALLGTGCAYAARWLFELWIPIRKTEGE